MCIKSKATYVNVLMTLGKLITILTLGFVWTNDLAKYALIGLV